MTSYLIFPDLASAQARSAQRAQELGYANGEWWAQIENQTTKQGALIVEETVRPTGEDFTKSGLTAGEQAALVPQTSMDASWSL